jgi:hypothetical protein
MAATRYGCMMLRFARALTPNNFNRKLVYQNLGIV